MNTTRKRQEEEPGKQKTSRKCAPDFIPDPNYCIPNYDKFRRMGWTVEETLAMLNID